MLLSVLLLSVILSLSDIIYYQILLSNLLRSALFLLALLLSVMIRLALLLSALLLSNLLTPVPLLSSVTSFLLCTCNVCYYLVWYVTVSSTINKNSILGSSFWCTNINKEYEMICCIHYILAKITQTCNLSIIDTIFLNSYSKLEHPVRAWRKSSLVPWYLLLTDLLLLNLLLSALCQLLL